jgi:hypothetical protein
VLILRLGVLRDSLLFLGLFHAISFGNFRQKSDRVPKAMPWP